MAVEDEPTNRWRILAADGHLCVHTIGSFGLLGLGHSFHVPQTEGRQAAHWENWYVRLHEHGGPAKDIDSMSTPQPTQRAQPFQRITENDALIRWLGGLQGGRTAVRDVEGNSVLKESYDQEETGYSKIVKRSGRG